MTTPPLPAARCVSISVAAPPDRVWAIVSDPTTPARFSDELQEAGFIDTDVPTVGAVIAGRNQRGTYEWSTLSTVVECEAPTRFTWAVGDPDDPVATWSFHVSPDRAGSVVTHTVTMHAGKDPFQRAIEREPERGPEIVDGRLSAMEVNMRRTLEGIASIAEA